jgi:hypothetical protein
MFAEAQRPGDFTILHAVRNQLDDILLSVGEQRRPLGRVNRNGVYAAQPIQNVFEVRFGLRGPFGGTLQAI